MSVYRTQVQVTPEFIAQAEGAVQLVEEKLRAKVRREHGEAASERGHVIWTARLEVEIPERKS